MSIIPEVLHQLEHALSEEATKKLVEIIPQWAWMLFIYTVIVTAMAMMFTSIGGLVWLITHVRVSITIL